LNDGGLITVAADRILNQLQITGRLAEKKTLRYTPAGIPVAEGRLEHQSEQVEARQERQAYCEIPVLALGDLANVLVAATIGAKLQMRGFLMAKSRNSKMLVLHAQTIEFLEGTKNG
jgi:primosomal replication protein N